MEYISLLDVELARNVLASNPKPPQRPGRCRTHRFFSPNRPRSSPAYKLSMPAAFPRKSVSALQGLTLCRIGKFQVHVELTSLPSSLPKPPRDLGHLQRAISSRQIDQY